MNPFIIVTHQSLSAAAEILLCLTVPLQFISVTAGFIFTKRHSCLHLILVCKIVICGRTGEHPRPPLHVLPSFSVTAQWATAALRTGFYPSTVQRDAQQGHSDQRQLQGHKHHRKLIFSGNALRVWAHKSLQSSLPSSSSQGIETTIFSVSLLPLRLSSTGRRVTNFSQVCLTLTWDRGLPV